MTGQGKILQEARRRRGLTLDDAERETRIRKRYLLALEQEDSQELPPPVYALGFLRVYAHYLDIDPDPLAAAFKEESGLAAHPQHLVKSPLIDFAPPPRQQPSTLVTIGLVVASALGAFFFFQAIRAPVTAAWSSLSSTVVPDAGVIRLPFASTFGMPWGSATITESAPKDPSPVKLGAVAKSETSGGGDRLPATANVPNVIVTAPWFAEPSAKAAGPGVSKMPRVLGETADEARVSLEKMGLAVATEQWWTPDVPAGFVVHQSPKAGDPIDRTQPAVVVISRGPHRFAMPDLAGHPGEEAQKLLRKAGLIGAPIVRYLSAKDLPPSLAGSICVGCVVSSSPTSGAELPPYGVVTLAIRQD